MTVSIGSFLRRERWGTCDASIGDVSRPGWTQRCNLPASYVDSREDGDGNHLRYCADCARNA